MGERRGSAPAQSMDPPMRTLRQIQAVTLRAAPWSANILISLLVGAVLTVQQLSQMGVAA
jgi:hypothetical protein